MIERVILSVVAVTMLLLTIHRKDRHTIVLTGGLTIGILFSWSNIPIIITVGMLLYAITAFFIALYGIKKKEMSIFGRVVTSIAGIWAFFVNIFPLVQYPFAHELRVSLLIPVLLFVIMIIRGIGKKNEFGFLSILNVDFLMRILRYWL